MRRAIPLLAMLAAAPAWAEERVLVHQGVERRTVLAGSTEPGPPRPLVVALHGLRQSVEHLQSLWSLDAVAAREGFIVAYPVALTGVWSYSPQRPVRLPGGEALVDDAGFVGALLDGLVSEGRVDPARVFVTGFSRGALMTWTLACAMAERFAAAAPLASPMTDGQVEPCRPVRPVPVLAVAGTADGSQIYDGWLYPEYRQLSMPETMELWRRFAGCTGQSWRALPHRERADPTRVTEVSWMGCAPGWSLRLLRVNGGGHALPRHDPDPGAPAWMRPVSRDFETAEEVWGFFAGVPARR